MRRAVRRAGIATGGATLALLSVVGIEIAAAIVRAEDLTGFPAPALDGPIGPDGGDLLRIVWVGDSTGEGAGASSIARSLPHAFARGLGRRVDLTVLAVSGARVADALADQVPQVPGRDPDWVVVGIGSNDVTHPSSRSAFRRDYAAILNTLVDAGAERVIALGIGEFAATPLFWQPLRAIVGARGHALERDQESLANRAGATWVDIRARTGPAFVAEPTKHHAADGFHPSDAGYALWAEAMLGTLEEVGVLDR